MFCQLVSQKRGSVDSHEMLDFRWGVFSFLWSVAQHVVLLRAWRWACFFLMLIPAETYVLESAELPAQTLRVLAVGCKHASVKSLALKIAPSSLHSGNIYFGILWNMDSILDTKGGDMTEMHQGLLPLRMDWSQLLSSPFSGPLAA